MAYEEKHYNRRTLLKGGLRTLLLGGLAAVCGLLGLRKSGAAGDGVVCDFKLPCAHCGKRSGCTDPKALESKLDNQNAG